MSAHAVDVLLATYNGEKYLEEQIESLFSQTYSDFRVIARDDGSHDSTPAILRIYHQKYGERFLVIDNEQPTGSAKDNFARLTELSTAPYTMYCDQDDYWNPDKIEKTLSAMREAEANNPDIPILVHSDLQVVGPDREVISRSLWTYQGLSPYASNNHLVVQNSITGCTVMINRVLRNAATPIPENVIMHDWWLGLIAAYIGKIIVINEPLMDYRQHGANDTGAKQNSLKHMLQRAITIIATTRRAKLVGFDRVMLKLREQVKYLLEAQGSKITQKDKQALLSFLKLGEFNYPKRVYIVVRYGFTMKGMARNMAYLLSI